jgi:hypothetical protein
MDPGPNVIRSQIASTRESLGRHLDELGSQIDDTKTRVKEKVTSSAQYWGAMSAVALGLIGAVAFWPRRVRRRRVLRSFQRANTM